MVCRHCFDPLVERMTMYSRLFLLVACGVSVSLSAQSSNYPPVLNGAREEIYKSVEGVDLKVWIFEPEQHKSSDLRPAIVFFFGGGWKQGSPAQFEQHCRYLASQGMVAMTADYRVRVRHNTLADKAVMDAKSAVRWIRQNASRLGIDPERIVAGGGSAGGHLAACTGVISGLEEENEALNVSSVPNAMALFNPAMLLASLNGVDYLPSEKLDDIASRTGVAPESISPIHHVRAGLPPMIIFHGEADDTVPFATVERYSEMATSAGNRCELAGYRGEMHGFFNFGKNGDPGEGFPRTVHRPHVFLASLGYLKSPPAIHVPESENVHLRGRLDHSYDAIVNKKEATVAFIGGSITEMNGYRVIISDMLKKRFKETEFTFVNAGISSTCSTTGAFRLKRDVLDEDPDLLLVEFAVNDDQDAVHAERECKRGMEGILRHTLLHNPKMDIVVTHFVNPPMLELLQQGETPISSGAHEDVARHYGVSTVDLAREVAEQISEGALTWKEYGGTHPKEPGNRLAAKLVEDLLTTAWMHRDGDSRPKHRIPKLLDSNCYVSGRLVDVRNADFDDGWQLGVPDWSNIPGTMRERFVGKTLLHSAAVGAECRLHFKGRGVGVFVLAGPDAGNVSYSIDNSEPRQADLYHRFSKGLHYPRSIVFEADLEKGDHDLVLRIGKPNLEQSERTAVRILHFLVN